MPLAFGGDVLAHFQRKIASFLVSFQRTMASALVLLSCSTRDGSPCGQPGSMIVAAAGGRRQQRSSARGSPSAQRGA